MDYRNWATGGSLEDEDSYDSSPPPSYGGKRSSDSGRQPTRASQSSGVDVYDFDISNDDEDGFQSKPYVSNSTSSARGSFGGRTGLVSGANPRKSLDERTKEIQNSFGGRTSKMSYPESPVPSPKSAKAGQSPVEGDWKRSYDELMAGIADSPENNTSRNNMDILSPVSPSGLQRQSKDFINESAGDSSYGDSLEISAADLEVGEYAKRRASEKTQDRKRRLAMDVAPHTQAIKSHATMTMMPTAKVAASPDLTSKMRGRETAMRSGAGVGGFQISAALSSINNSSDDEDAQVPSKKGMQRYGSVEKSDAELFKVLGGTKAKNASLSGTAHLSSLGDEDSENDADDNDDSGDSDLAQSNDFDQRRAPRRDVNPREDDISSSDPDEPVKPAESQEDTRRRSIEEIRQRWLPSAPESAAILNEEEDREEIQHVHVVTVPAPHSFLAAAPTKDSLEMSNSMNDDDEDDGDKEQSRESFSAGSKLLTAVGSASMVTSVPPPPPAIMSESAEFMVTTTAGVSIEQNYSVNSNHSNYERESASTPPVPSYTASLLAPALPALQAADIIEAPRTINPRYSTVRDDNDSSFVEQESLIVPEDVAAAVSEPAPPFEDTARVAVPDIPQALVPKVALEDIVPVQASSSISFARPAGGLTTSSDHLSTAPISLGFGKTELSTGQPALNKIVAFEVDPYALGLTMETKSSAPFGMVAQSVAVKSRTCTSLSPARPPPAPATTWPKELPLVAPSAANLHAHIAMMENTDKRRIAAATAQKIKNFQKNKNATATGTESTGRSASGGARKITKRNSQGAPVEPAAVTRLEQGTARLARQYEELQQELQNLKIDKGSKETKSVQVSSSSSHSLVQATSPSRLQNQPRTIARSFPNESISDVRDENSGVWQSVALQTMKKIVEEGDRLGDREKNLAIREEALRLRESVTELGAFAAISDASLAAKKESAITSVFSSQGVPPNRLKDDEFLEMQQREALAVAEVARLKALLFELQNVENANDTSIPIKTAKPTRQHYKAAGNSNTSAAVEDGVETITVPKSEYEKMIHEIASQETLISGFQKENERLVSTLRVKEAEENMRKAQFFDKQESLNKELNRLRNVEEGGGQGVRKSFEALRQELDIDATIRALKERLALAESGAGVREKEMQLTIDKLRKDNRQLAATSAKVPSDLFDGTDDNHAALIEKQRKHEEEIKSLKTKLSWYAENQVLLESIEQDRTDALSQLNILKRELRKKGVDNRTLSSLLKQPASPNDEPAEETSMVSQTTKNTSRVTSGRSNADVKKIKELENVISELQECLRKRHPDSITSLVRAAAMSDSVQAERQRESDAVEAMRQELIDAKTNYELRLRSIRQEHEKLEVGYKNRIASLEQASNTAATPSKSSSISGNPTSGSKVGSGPIKTLAQATIRIRELEEEAERIRTFYTKKVDDVQRKADTQMRALKRSGNSPDSPETPDSGAVEGLATSMAALKDEYEERLRVMEDELVRTVQELAVAKKEAQNSRASASRAVSSEIPIAFVTPETVRAHPSFEVEVQREAEMRHMRQRLADIEASKTAPVVNVRRGDNEVYTDKVERSTGVEKQDWAEERERLLRRIREEETRARDLQSELSRVRSQAQEQSNTGPNIHLLQSMENQLTHLEGRLQRREKELAQAVEEGRSASKMERARLEALHAQELREKDEQLVKFQQELEQLVYALRQWQYASSSSESSPNIMYHPPPSTQTVFV